MRTSLLATLTISLLTVAARAEPPSEKEAADALRKAITFYRTRVASHGGYVWRYSADLAKREGEGAVGLDTVWVQPPGTPAVGLAYLDAYRATGEKEYLEAAREAARVLLRGQLRSGGWTARIDLGPKERGKLAYRDEPVRAKARNVTSLDDDMTQAALRFLIQLDQALDFKDKKIHEAVEYALASLLKAQYPIGAWPQGYTDVPEMAEMPVRRARFPETWSRTYQGHNRYWRFYTLNDNTLVDTLEVLLLAGRVYERRDCRAAALKAADFLLLAQLPAPQPAWAQQYDFEMQPTWARKFEPPAVSGSESQRVLQTLLMLYDLTGEKKYLDAVKPGLDYLKKSRLPDGRLARFYELKTNRPLYFTRDYQLTDKADDLPTHYGFIVDSKLDGIEREYERLVKEGPSKQAAVHKPRARGVLGGRARAVIDALDERGAWVEEGKLRFHGKADPTTRIIEGRTFLRNVEILTEFLRSE
ncbi:MAG: pectate lyase [Gemmataceae bacterium]